MNLRPLVHALVLGGLGLLTACTPNTNQPTGLTVTPGLLNPPGLTQASPSQLPSTSQLSTPGQAVVFPTALTPATLGPTPTQSQPELTPRFTEAEATPIPFGTAQSAGVLTVMPSHFEWQTASGSTQAPAGYVYLAITVSLQNTSPSDTVQFDPTQLSILNADGTVLAAISSPTSTNSLAPQQIKPGDQLQGVVMYQIPQSQQNETEWSLLFRSANNADLKWRLAA